MKQIICFLFGHKWTSKAIKGEKPTGELRMDEFIANFIDYTKLYCDRCGEESKLNSRLTQKQ